jgi:hypothetical protein
MESAFRCAFTLSFGSPHNGTPSAHANKTEVSWKIERGRFPEAIAGKLGDEGTAELSPCGRTFTKELN